MAETLSTLSIIAFALSGVFLGLTLFFWTFFKIPTVVGDLSGRNARRAIARMRADNEKSGVKEYKGSKTNAERGKLTGMIPKENKHGKGKNGFAQKAPKASDRPDTGILQENKAEPMETAATGILKENEGEAPEYIATGLLSEGETTGTLELEPEAPAKRTGGKKLTMIEDIILIHTKETIQ